MNKIEKILIAILLGIIVVYAAITVGFWYWQKNKAAPISIATNNPVQTAPIQNQNPLNDIFTPPPMTGSWTPAENTANVQWRGDGLTMSDLKLVVALGGYLDPSAQDMPSVKYYDMGVDGGNKIILAITDAIDLSGPSLFFFEQIPGGYRFMQRVSTYSTYNPDTKYGYVLSSKVLSADTTAFYAGVVGPTDFTYKGLQLEQPYLSLSDLFQTSSLQGSGYSINKIDTVPYGELYLQQEVSNSQDNNTPEFYLNRYIIKLPSGLYTEYNIKYNFFSDNSVPSITWNDGTKNQDNYHQDAHLGGCGNPGSSVVAVKDVSKSLQQTGTTGTGEAIYELKNINDPVMKSFYDLYGGAYNNSTGQFDKIPLQDWYTHHPVVFYKNSIGQYVIFTNDKYGLQAECGKPVIYLYPTQTTNVKVQVGADITKSEPVYNNGWEVTASPDGTLTTADGAKYDSLFWEGTGHGDYPNITKGFVVPQSQLTSTIRSQLKELGLSDKESADFLIFWLPKIPNTPYVRLTWFTTDQMNKLVPLIVLPKPDTLIRVFLDFSGLQNNIPLPAQHLTALPRKGFTAVEWGGLLRK